MKQIFDEMGNRLAKTGKNVVNKTKSMNEISKVKYEIGVEEEKLHLLFHDIGIQYYEENQHACSSEFESLFGQVKQQEKILTHLNEQLVLIKGIRLCPRCQQEVKASAIFCGQCGLNIITYLNEKRN